MEHKKFAFISDFDGTLTNKDFYKMIIDEYLGEEGKELYKAWRRNEYKDKDFLHKIYSSINRDEDEILEDILKIEWDKNADKVIQKVKEAGGDFIILSAGTSYYIDRLLKEKGLSDIKVYSNPGEYKNRGIHLNIDENNPYYSEVYGIDKGKIVADLKHKYSYVYYAGDSAPDIPPCKLADICFAKGTLQGMLQEEGVNFIPMSDYRDIEKSLIEKGAIEE